MPQSSESARFIFVAIAALIAVSTHLVYFLNVLKGRTKPHAFSWFIWAILGGIGFFGQLSGHGGAGAYVTGLMCVLCTLICLLALRRGEKSITRLDWGCLIFGLLAIPLWLLTAEPFYSMILISIIDAVGFVPTFRKAFLCPHEETALTFFGNLLKWLLAILALDTVSITTAIYPASLVFSNAAFILMLLYRRRVDAEKISVLLCLCG